MLRNNNFYIQFRHLGPRAIFIFIFCIVFFPLMQLLWVGEPCADWIIAHFVILGVAAEAGCGLVLCIYGVVVGQGSFIWVYRPFKIFPEELNIDSNVTLSIYRNVVATLLATVIALCLVLLASETGLFARKIDIMHIVTSFRPGGGLFGDSWNCSIKPIHVKLLGK